MKKQTGLTVSSLIYCSSETELLYYREKTIIKLAKSTDAKILLAQNLKKRRFRVR